MASTQPPLQLDSSPVGLGQALLQGGGKFQRRGLGGGSKSLDRNPLDIPCSSLSSLPLPPSLHVHGGGATPLCQDVFCLTVDLIATKPVHHRLKPLPLDVFFQGIWSQQQKPDWPSMCSRFSAYRMTRPYGTWVWKKLGNSQAIFQGLDHNTHPPVP